MENAAFYVCNRRVGEMYEVLYELHNLFRGIRLRGAAVAAFVLRLISFTVGNVLREQLKIHAPLVS